MQDSSIAHQIRTLRARHGWTTQDMAEKTGLPKRTLDSYMRRENPPLPGLEALRKMAVGLGVSLDWLVFGEDFGGARGYLLAHMSARRAALPIVKNLYEAIEQKTPLPVAEYVAIEIGAAAGEFAKAVAAYGLTWKFTEAVVQDLNESLTKNLNAKEAELADQIENLKHEAAARNNSE